MNDQQLLQSYDYCRNVAKTNAGNFYYSFIVLPAERRRAMHAVYAFMRYCDDIVDEDSDMSSDHDDEADGVDDEFLE